jgi:solute carrier family 44 protein 1 (choline transporter-like protein)
MWWYHLFGLFWTSQFVIACQHVTVAGVVAMWYFTYDKKRLPKRYVHMRACMGEHLPRCLTSPIHTRTSPVTTMMGRVVCYHLGSVAFGSFLIAVVMVCVCVLCVCCMCVCICVVLLPPSHIHTHTQLARAALAYVSKKLKGKTGTIVQLLLKCLALCLWCFEKVCMYP